MQRVLALILVFASAVSAQQSIGINVSRNGATLSGVLCGFQCGSHLGRADVGPLEVISVRLIGDANLPAGLLITPGPALSGCPGLTLRGIAHSMVLNPGLLIAGSSTPALTGPNRSCGAGANQPMLTSLPIPSSASGRVLAVQGIV